MIQKLDMWLTEDWGGMNTTPCMKCLRKYFEKNVKGYFVASGSPINCFLRKAFLIFEEIMKSRRSYCPVSSELNCLHKISIVHQLQEKSMNHVPRLALSSWTRTRSWVSIKSTDGLTGRNMMDIMKTWQTDCCETQLA